MSYNVYDAECSSRQPTARHGLFYYSVHSAGILRKHLPHPILCVLVTSQGLFAGISKFIQGKLFPVRIRRGSFFLSLSPYKDLYRDHLTVTQGGKSCFSCTSPFYFRWALQEFCNRCFRDICLKFTGYLLFYMLLQFRLKSFFFNIIVIVFTESHQVTMISCKRPIRFPQR